MTTGRYLDLLASGHTVAPQTPYFESPATSYVFTTYESYLKHVAALNYSEFSSFFEGRQLSLRGCLQLDLEHLYLIEQHPLSYLLSVVMHAYLEQPIPRNDTLALPGDVVSYQGGNYVIVGMRDTGFIGRLFNSFQIQPSFNAYSACVSGQLAIFTKIELLHNSRRVFGILREIIYNYDYFLTAEIQHFAQRYYSGVNYAQTLVITCLTQVRQKLDEFKAQLAQFKYFASEATCAKFIDFSTCADAARSVIAIAQYSRKAPISRVSFRKWASYHYEDARRHDFFEVVRARAKKRPKAEPIKYTEQELHFKEFLEGVDSAQLLADFKAEYLQEKEAAKADKVTKQQYVAQLVKLTQAETYPAVADEKMLGLYLFFFRYAHLLGLPLCSFEQFSEAIAYEQPCGLYNDEVHPFYYQLIARLTTLLFYVDIAKTAPLLGVRGSRGWEVRNPANSISTASDYTTEEDDNSETYRSESQSYSYEYSYSYSDDYSQSSQPKKKTKKGAAAKPSESSAEQSYEYEYETSEEEESVSDPKRKKPAPKQNKAKNSLKNKLNGFITSSSYSSDYSGSSCEDDYIIKQTRKPRLNTKKQLLEKKKQMMEKKKEAQRIAKEKMPYVARKAVEDTVSDISDSVVQGATAQDALKTEFSDIAIPERQQVDAEAGCADREFVQQLLYYILEISLAEKDLYALQFVCPLLNHLTHKFDEAFHGIYKKLENAQHVSWWKSSMCVRYRVMHSFGDPRLKDLWSPDPNYPCKQFLSYGKMLGHDYGLTDEQVAYYTRPISVRVQRAQRFRALREVFKNHPVTKFVLLPLYLKYHLISFLIENVQKCDKFIAFVKSGENDAFEQMRTKQAELFWINRNVAQARAAAGLQNLKLTFEQYVEKEKAKIERQIQTLELKAQKSYLLASAGLGLWLLEMQTLHGDKIYLKTLSGTVQVGQEWRELAKQMLGRDQKFLLSQEANDGCVYTVKDDDRPRVTRYFYMQQVNRMLASNSDSAMLCYNLNNNLGLGQMFLGRKQLLAFLQAQK